MNIAYRAGRWSAAHWKTATFLWLAVVIVATVAGNLAGTINLSNAAQGAGPSARAQTLLTKSGFKNVASEQVLVQNRSLSVSDPRFRREIERVAAAIEPLRQIDQLKSPLTPGNSGQISKDGHSALVEFNMRGNPDTAGNRVQPVLNTVARLQRGAPGFTVAEFGDATSELAQSNATTSGIQKAEELSLPITFLILLIGFGAFVAAGIPVLLAFSAVIGAGGLAAIASHVFNSSSATSSVMLLMGMAVGVDYSLFYLKREREERRAGHSHRDALERAAATSGRAVLASGITVLIAMAGMLLSGSTTFESLGVGAMLVVLMAMVGSLTVLPALLSRLGDKVDKGRIRRPRTESRIWKAILTPVLRRPKPAALISAGVLVVLALPALGMHTILLGPADMPHGTSAYNSYEKIQKAFPGSDTPAWIALRGNDLTSPQAHAAIGRLEHLALSSGQFKKPIQVMFNGTHRGAQIAVPLVGNGSDARSTAAMLKLREQILPASLGHLHGATYAVTGQTAGSYDATQQIKDHMPIVFAFVLGLAFLLMLVTFRSIVIPITSIALNLLSVGAAYGVLVWIFQDGHLQRLLGFHSDGAIVTWLPLFLFAVLFGLSMDYHVFIISRIKELRDGGMSTSDAVGKGIGSTAGTVTAAAAVMVAVFAIFAWLPSLDIKQLGVGLAVAVLLDATVIRGILLPATMKMLGDWNWYLPRRLSWLPRVSHDAARAGAPGAVRPSSRPVGRVPEAV
ncbi:MAG: MMPL family transporter [Conexibacteraceae bacterium]|nr:MMPL family transporter [Conexibacteraceae bacterium]